MKPWLCRALVLGRVLLVLAAAPTCARSAASAAPPVWLFTGTGTSANDVRALEALLGQMGVAYAPLTAPALAQMSSRELRRARVLIMPGGDFLAMGAALSPGARDTLRVAVQDGLNYLGICAGAFLAGDAPYPSLKLVPGVRFEFYAAARAGVRKAAVPITLPTGSAPEHYWEDGPQLSGWGAILAKYPDGTPAVVEGRAGQGWVLLTGIHPEAPASWRRDLAFTTPVERDAAYARVLIDAAMRGIPLPHF